MKKYILSLAAMCWITVMYAEIVHHQSATGSINQRGFTKECWEDTETDKLYADADCTQELNAAEVITYASLAIDPVIHTEGFTAKREATYKSAFINTTTLQWPVEAAFAWNDTGIHVAEFIVCGSGVQHARLKWLKDIGYNRYGRFVVNVYVNGRKVYALEQGQDEDLSGVFDVPLPGLKTRDVVRLEARLCENIEYTSVVMTIAASLEYTRENDRAVLPLVIKADDKEKTLGEADPALTWHCQKGTMTYGNPVMNLTRDAGEAPGKYTIHASVPDDANANYAIAFVDGTMTIIGVTHHNASQPTISQRGYAQECWEDLVTGYYYADAECTNRKSPAEIFSYVKLTKDPYVGGVGFKSCEPSSYDNPQSDWAVETVYLLNETDTRFAEFEVYGADVKNARIKWYKDNWRYAKEGLLLVKIYVNGELVYTYDRDDESDPLFWRYSVPLPDLKTGDRVRFEVSKPGTDNSVFYSNTLFTACLEYERSGIAYVPLTIKALNRDKLVDEKDPELLWSIVQGSTLPGYDLGSIVVKREEGEAPGRYTIHASKSESTNPVYDITFKDGTFTIMSREEADYTEVATLEELRTTVNATDFPRIKLTSDIYLNGMKDILCSNFSGTIDGDGHALVGSAGGRVKCAPLFTDAVGALIQNLTFRDIRIDSEDNSHLGALAQRVTDCTIKNVTMDHVSVWTDEGYAGTIAGSAEGCYFENVQVNGCDVAVDSDHAGGLVGYSSGGHFINCSTDEHSSVFSDGNDDGHFQWSLCGGLVGLCKQGEFIHCVNRAIVGGDFQYIGGILGEDDKCKLSNCINAGLVLSIDESDFGPLSERYRRGELPRNTYRYGGEVYSPQYLTADDLKLVDTDGAIGGIEGRGYYSHVTECVNFGPFYGTSTSIVGFDGLGGIIGHAVGTHVESCANYGFNAKEGAKYVGGIVGEARSTIINNCFNATASVYGSTASNGSIVGKVWEMTKVNNCLSAVAQRIVGDDWSMEGYYDHDWIDPATGNNYRLEADNDSNEWEMLVSSDQLKRGLVALWLNNGVENREKGIRPWHQNLWVRQVDGEEEERDNWPNLDATHDEVTADLLCDDRNAGSEYVYKISDASGLQKFADDVNSGKQFLIGYLDADIVMPAGQKWTPIGKNEANKHFRGVFDGQGHTISGLEVEIASDEQGAGLFGAVHTGAVICNVIVDGTCKFTNSKDGGAAGIVGKVKIGWNWGSVVIENCGSHADINVNKHGGGILGHVDTGRNESVKVYVNNCYSMGTVTAENGNSALLCGYTQHSGVVSNSWSGGQLRNGTNKGIWPYSIENDNGVAECFVGYLSNVFDIKDCYILNLAANVDRYDEEKEVHPLQAGVEINSAEDLASGKFTYQLNGNSNDVNQLLTWQQNLGTDVVPIPGNKGVYHSREMSQKDYGTICVPYPLASNKKLGSVNRQYYIFKNVNKEADGTLSLCFEYADVVPAGTPALFITFYNSIYTFDAAAEEFMFTAQATGDSDWNFTGTYEQKVFEGDEAKSIYYVDGSMNKAAIKNAKRTTINPFRAYFVGPSIDDLSSSGAKAARVRFMKDGVEDETLALELVAGDLMPKQSGKAYTLFGTEAGSDYRGLMIRGDKKIMVRE